MIATHGRSMKMLDPPDYIPPCETRINVGMAVEDMRHHMTDEGWQIFAGLQWAGYKLAGFNLNEGYTNTKTILNELRPQTIVMQDKREWDVSPINFRDKRGRFINVDELAFRPDVFKLTILKDAQNNPHYHRDSAIEIGCHGWIIYYSLPIVYRLAPFIRPQHTIRTYHTVDSRVIPPYLARGRNGCLLSGAVSNCYPLRKRLVKCKARLYKTSHLSHPGYHRQGSATPGFMNVLSRYKVAICTASVYGYALRKIIEATACGCRVITDLPPTEILPFIDGNLYRVSPDIPIAELNALISNLIESYDPEAQSMYTQLAMSYYDYRATGYRLVKDIETLRMRYLS